MPNRYEERDRLPGDALPWAAAEPTEERWRRTHLDPASSRLTPPAPALLIVFAFGIAALLQRLLGWTA